MVPTGQGVPFVGTSRAGDRTVSRMPFELDEQLLLDDPDSATYMSQFLAHASVLGQALTGLQRNTEAIEVLRRSLRIANRLFEERKNEGFRQARGRAGISSAWKCDRVGERELRRSTRSV